MHCLSILISLEEIKTEKFNKLFYYHNGFFLYDFDNLKSLEDIKTPYLIAQTDYFGGIGEQNSTIYNANGYLGFKNKIDFKTINLGIENLILLSKKESFYFEIANIINLTGNGPFFMFEQFQQNIFMDLFDFAGLYKFRDNESLEMKTLEQHKNIYKVIPYNSNDKNYFLNPSFALKFLDADTENDFPLNWKIINKNQKDNGKLALVGVKHYHIVGNDILNKYIKINYTEYFSRKEKCILSVENVQKISINKEYNDVY